MMVCRRVVVLSFSSILVEHGLAWVLSHHGSLGRPQQHLLLGPGRGQNFNHQPNFLCSTAPGKGSNKQVKYDYLEDHLEDAYRIAREEDEIWFKTTLSGLLEHESATEAEVFKMPGESSKLSESFVDRRILVLGDSNNETLRSLLDTKISGASPTANLSSTSFVSSTATVDDIKGREYFGGRTRTSRRIAIATVPKESSGEYRNTSATVRVGKGQRGEAVDRKDDSAMLDKETNAISSVFIRFVNNSGRDEEVPLKDLTKLGYKSSEVRRLKSSSIVAILRAGLRRPSGGIPKHWTVRSNRESKVEISRSTPMSHNQSTVERGKFPRRRKESFIRRPSINHKRRTGQNSKSGEASLYARRKQPARSISGGSTSRPGSDNSFADREVWMDLPMFRAFLRKEAQLRLTILGPGWSNAVKGESRWRLEMYQKWLDLLYGDENGGWGKTTHRQRSGKGAKERRRKNILRK
mmetsp:Transcript_12943/g.27950  ORF Transcript_12943/g.27950 Transcript_12943/m.27950 type:complete len:466 (+) Transcript_12943:119-1516(+)